MQRKHFEAIARVIAEELPRAFDDYPNVVSNASYREQVAREFAEMLKATNPRFDFTRFMLACGIDADADVMDPSTEYVMGVWVKPNELSSETS